MKSKYFFKICLCLFLVSLSFSCGEGGGDIIDTLIPDLTANWKNINDTQRDDEYFFLVDNAGASSSTFTGNETIDNTTQYTFSGSYQNSKINFTFTSGPKNGTKYTGKINGNSANATMTITTPAGTITLQKNG